MVNLTENQQKFLEKIRFHNKDGTELQLEYWEMYSNLSTWQFWLEVTLLIAPLIVLIIFIDKKRIFQVGFFGLNYHVWFAYTNAIGIRMGLWEYPYLGIPFLPSFTLDASLVPVVCMLVYQWVLSRNKNIWLYGLLLSGVLAFAFKPVIVHFNFFRMHHGISFIHLFIFYCLFFLISLLITNFFLFLKRRNSQQ